MDLLDRFFAQLNAIQSVWMPFLVAMFVACFAIWKAMDWRYNGIIARLREDITYLERAISREAKHPPVHEPTPTPALSARATTQIPSPERVYLPGSVTIEFMAKLRTELTGAQADKILSTYVGKWLRVKGPFPKQAWRRGKPTLRLTLIGPSPRDNGYPNKPPFGSSLSMT
ncbi:hypothetical protein [Sphingomonas sp. G-3-2-10]|uniref:hypothetical protein n=1 Tax=Sphingomonas sp. G-3-2-10 TaxID=2728838 RepID=UPI001F0CEABF|nr:hypothetical protein [Sphingomonas sp. G-3-2-10]